jgi:peroxiredoxin
MLELGTAAPPFALPDVVTGRTITLDTFKSQKGILVMFICRHCPYVQHIQEELANVGHEYSKKGVGVVAISANDAKEYPDDAPPSLKEMAQQLGFAFPFCYDETQDTAKAYSAACTPDFFLFDQSRQLVYRGQFDDSRPASGIPVTGRDLRAALDAVTQGRAVSREQKPSLGCNIKWKKGHEPNYFGAK